ncbi:MAG TPA: hypothetical protein VGR77_06040 [Candidatus Dormibacteraeota bacterium]|nr:hypothetical protein [Candidatus Dormibacteraeota bacterium]
MLDPDPAAGIFGADHPGSIEVLEHSVKFGMVEEAKRTALARALAAAGSTGLLPAELGLLGVRRYPRGALVVWRLPQMPPDDVAWRDVARVLGIETWNRWEGENERLLVGVPTDDGTRLWQADGLSLLLTGVSSDDQNSGDAFDLAEKLRHWLPWLLVMQCTYQLTEDAGLLRQDLDRARLGRKGLEPLAAALYECYYRLSRLKHATSEVGDGRHIGFPDLVRYDPLANRPEVAKPSQAEPPNHDLQAQLPSLNQRRDTLREGVIASIPRTLTEGFEEVQLSLNRARTLAELNTGTAIRFWTRVVAGLTIVLCLLTLVLVYQAFHQAPSAPARSAAPSTSPGAS